VAEALSKNERYQQLITPEFISKIQNASVTHDIGKVGIKDSILLKPGKLTADEFEHIKTHPVIGANVLKQVYHNYPGNKYIEMGIEIAESHHEKWDGSGYPYQLKQDQIPLSAQILAICDVYDALRSRRPYKEPLDHQTSMNQILSDKGTHFNPEVVDAFIACEEVIKELYTRLLD
jgi:putative two-component system response regulator